MNKRLRRQKAAKHPTSRHRLRFELLEDRRLMAGIPELLKDINVGATGSILSPTQFVEVGATTFFVANNGTSRQELWKTNGTAAGTVLVKDIAPGVANSYPINLTNVNGTLFFSADDTGQRYQEWKHHFEPCWSDKRQRQTIFPGQR